MKIILTGIISGIVSLVFAGSAFADITINMHFTDKSGAGKSAGTLTIQPSEYGLLFIPNLKGLTPGAHGFHIHQNPSCDDGGMAAGGHFDPQNTSKHLGPYNPNGHLGDLPILYVAADGNATTPVLAPRLALDQIKNHALMLHAGGDNYSDEPAKLGGGGARMVCGVID